MSYRASAPFTADWRHFAFGVEHLVSLQIFVTDVDAYRAAMEPIGGAYRALFGTHYPPMTLLGVVAVIPDPG
ncbi:MAG: hypothetical protein ACRDZ4_23260 [Egibacteraceae bacterium]